MQKIIIYIKTPHLQKDKYFKFTRFPNCVGIEPESRLLSATIHRYRHLQSELTKSNYQHNVNTEHVCTFTYQEPALLAE